MEKLRTQQQNKAIHVLFRMIADTLNDTGFEKQITLGAADIPWNPTMVKEYLWRPVMRTQLGKESTKEMTTREIDMVFDVINKALAEKGIEIVFPSAEEMMMQQAGWKRGVEK